MAALTPDVGLFLAVVPRQQQPAPLEAGRIQLLACHKLYVTIGNRRIYDRELGHSELSWSRAWTSDVMLQGRTKVQARGRRV
eukprot:2332085-Amphidinium_carterae.1